MRRIAWLALVTLVSSTASAKKIEVAGDPDEGTDPAIVRASLDGVTAKFVVDYHFAPDESTMMFSLPLPKAAVVTGATVSHAGITHRLTLDSAENVEKQFSTMYGEPKEGAAPDIWAAKITMESYGSGDGSSVSVTLVRPIAAELVLSLEIVAPTCFLRDQRHVRVPATWEKSARSAREDDRVNQACDATRPDGLWMSFPAPDVAAMPNGERIGARAARLAVEDDLHLARTEIALATNLADIPRDLATVILVDESRSMTNEQRRSQRETVLGYLRAAPNSRVQVLAFSRRTRALLPGWSVASRAMPRVERELASLSPRNGSNFDRGLEMASRLLAQIKGTRRVLLVTDEAMATRLQNKPERLASVLPPHTIINTVVTAESSDTDDDGDVKLTRADNAQLARLAAATTGFSTAIGELGAERRKPVDAAMLVRPMSLDHLAATGLGWSELDPTTRVPLEGQTCIGSLDAGDACVFWARGTKFAGAVQIEGLLWNRRVMRVLRPLGDPGHTIAREIVGTNASLVREIDPEGVKNVDEAELGAKVDALAHSVTNTTALFARWGGSVPFAEGFGSGGYGGTGRWSDIGGVGTIGHGRVVSIGPVDLSSQLQPLVDVCQLGDARANVTLELTFQEIVDVKVAIEGGGARTHALETCVEEITWEFLPALPTMEASRTVHVVLR